MWPREIRIMDKAGRCVSKSKNLRGMLTYSRRISDVTRIDLYKDKYGGTSGQLGVEWSNGATTICDFNSYEIMERFAHRRTFAGATIYRHDAYIPVSK